MHDSILTEGDQAIFIPNFGPAMVFVRPGELTATGPATIKGKRICVVGDEKQVKVQGCTYMTPLYSIPGVGTLEIAALAGNQKASKTKTGGQAVLLKGGNFTAKFTVMVPALQPPPGPSPPIPDASPQYSGNGVFKTTNLTIKGS
jgi:Contractile injection system spike tip protein